MFRVTIFLILSVFSLQAGQPEPYSSVKTQIETRWQAFQTDREFKDFKTRKLDTELKEEFENIHKTRLSIWTTPGYEFAQNLIAGDLIRAPGCVAFDFNNTVPLLQCQNGHAYLNIPIDTGVYSVQAFHMDHWRDRHGVDPEELLALAPQIRV